MEQNQETHLFGFGIDQESRNHLSEAAKWAKFLAIFGFIVCGFIAIAGVFMGTIFSSLSYGNSYRGSGLGDGLVVLMTLLYVGIAIIYFFPCLFLLRFANHMRNALTTNDQMTLNASFKNLKVMFRFVGILTIVVISLYIILFFIGMVGAASSSAF